MAILNWSAEGIERREIGSLGALEKCSVKCASEGTAIGAEERGHLGFDCGEEREELD